MSTKSTKRVAPPAASSGGGAAASTKKQKSAATATTRAPVQREEAPVNDGKMEVTDSAVATKKSLVPRVRMWGTNRTNIGSVTKDSKPMIPMRTLYNFVEATSDKTLSKLKLTKTKAENGYQNWFFDFIIPSEDATKKDRPHYIHTPPLVLRKLTITGVGSLPSKDSDDSQRGFWLQLAIMVVEDMEQFMPGYIADVELFAERMEAVRERYLQLAWEEPEFMPDERIPSVDSAFNEIKAELYDADQPAQAKALKKSSLAVQKRAKEIWSKKIDMWDVVKELQEGLAGEDLEAAKAEVAESDAAETEQEVPGASKLTKKVQKPIIRANRKAFYKEAKKDDKPSAKGDTAPAAESEIVDSLEALRGAGAVANPAAAGKQAQKKKAGGGGGNDFGIIKDPVLMDKMITKLASDGFIYNPYKWMDNEGTEIPLPAGASKLTHQFVQQNDVASITICPRVHSSSKGSAIRMKIAGPGYLVMPGHGPDPAMEGEGTEGSTAPHYSNIDVEAMKKLTALGNSVANNNTAAQQHHEHEEEHDVQAEEDHMEN